MIAAEYVLSVGTAAVIIGILTGFLDSKSSIGTLTRMVCGLFLVFTVLKPIDRINFGHLTEYADAFADEGEATAARGTEMANDALRDIIKLQTEAYILDKAGSYNAELDVQVCVTETDCPLPESVRISGHVSPYVRSRLQQMISDELGIPKEKQLWTG